MPGINLAKYNTGAIIIHVASTRPIAFAEIGAFAISGILNEALAHCCCCHFGGSSCVVNVHVNVSRTSPEWSTWTINVLTFNVERARIREYAIKILN
jgi:hypothetical protein